MFKSSRASPPGEMTMCGCSVILCSPRLRLRKGPCLPSRLPAAATETLVQSERLPSHLRGKSGDREPPDGCILYVQTRLRGTPKSFFAPGDLAASPTRRCPGRPGPHGPAGRPVSPTRAVRCGPPGPAPTPRPTPASRPPRGAHKAAGPGQAPRGPPSERGSAPAGRPRDGRGPAGPGHPGSRVRPPGPGSPQQNGAGPGGAADSGPPTVPRAALSGLGLPELQGGEREGGLARVPPLLGPAHTKSRAAAPRPLPARHRPRSRTRGLAGAGPARPRGSSGSGSGCGRAGGREASAPGRGGVGGGDGAGRRRTFHSS